MKYTPYLFVIALFLFILSSCGSARLAPTIHTVYPDPVDTKDKPVEMQVKKTYTLDGISVDNEFDGARMNGFEMMNDTTFRVIISPENYPINASSYFSFRISSESVRDIDLELYYTKEDHRYVPKLSLDRKLWMPMHTNDFDTLKAANTATLRLEIGPQPMFVSAQELVTSEDIRAWADKHAAHPAARIENVGKSKLGRDIFMLDICQGNCLEKDAVVIFSRQHPPEVSGYMAMEAFVEEMLNDSKLSNDFRQSHRILVYPLINPDGVDLGHWRHNAGGIDLNRDWSHYRQEEPRVVAHDVVKKVRTKKNRVVFGIDFHSTQKDLYYTLTDNRLSHKKGLKDYWFEGLDQAFEEYTPDERAYDLNQPITKGWFFLELGAESITYEIGDETPRDFVRQKGRVAAQELMKLLILND